MKRGEWSQWITYVKENAGKLKADAIAKHIGCTKKGLLRRCKRWRSEGIDIPYMDNIKRPEIGDTKEQSYGTVVYKKVWDGKKWRSQGRADGTVRKRGPKEERVIGSIIEKEINGVVYLYQKIGIDKYKSLGRKDGTVGRKGPAPKPKVPKVKKVKEKKVVQPKIPKVSAKTVYREQRHAAMKKKEAEKIPTRVIDPSTLKSVRVNRTTVIQVDRSIPDEEAINRWYEKHEKQKV